MPYVLNVVYLAALILASPWLIYKAITTGKYRVGMWRKFWGLAPVRAGDRPCAWFHAVSVGEVLLLKRVIERFRSRWPHWQCVLSTTTNTGYEVAVKNYPDLCVFYWPFDFSWAVRRALRNVRPSLVVLAELELWPNFVRLASDGQVPIAVVNGRMSPRSYRGYTRLRWLMRQVLSRVDLLAMQSQEYAERVISLGAVPRRVQVTGSVKYDGVNADRANPRTRELARMFNLDLQPPSGSAERQLVWIVGSTMAPEEELALGIYRRALEKFPHLQFILVPRHKERFDEAASLLARSGLAFVRRSHLGQGQRMEVANGSRPIILLDTLGELGAAWGLADVAFVGGSLGKRGGQNMIEPAAYGAAVTFGPHTWNFKDTVERLLACRGSIQVADAEELERVTLDLLGDAEQRRRLGEAARGFVLSQQGATERTLDLLAPWVEGLQGERRCA